METVIEPTLSQHSPAVPTKRRMIPQETWLAARTDFVRGKGTMDEIADKWGISRATLRDRAFKDDWSKQKLEWIDTVRNAIVPIVQRPIAPIEPTEGDPTGIRRETLQRQLQNIDKLLENEDDADKLDKLSRTRQRTFQEWQVLAGVPNPGSRRPARISSKRTNAQPIAPVESPAPSEP